MIKDFQKQNGSAHVVIIIILIIAIVGALSFIAWDNFFKPKNNTSRPQQTTSVTKTTDPNEGYTSVQEWGIKFKNSDELKSTQIQQERVVSSDATPQVSYAFTTTRIKVLGGSCTSGVFGRTEILTRYTDKLIATPDGELLNSSPIAGYYYVLGAPSASCTVVDSDGTLKQGAVESPVELNDRVALKASIRTISLLE